MKKPEKNNPEESPFFSHYRYDGNKIQQALKIGRKTPVFKTAHADAVEKWANSKGSDVVVSFAESYPQVEVKVSEDDGSMKTVTLPKWAIQKNYIDPASYYAKSGWVFR